MSDSKGFSVSVYLNCLFNDHRVVSRVYVNKSLKTITDLINHIKAIFEINNNIRLLHENNNLPNAEDVRVLQANDIVVVVLDEAKSQEERTFNGLSESPKVVKIKHKKKKKRDVSDQEEIDIPANETIKKKKKKSKAEVDIVETTTPELTAFSDERKKKKKCKSKLPSKEYDAEEILPASKESPEKINKLKSKKNEIELNKTVLPAQELTNESRITSKSNEDAVDKLICSPIISSNGFNCHISDYNKALLKNVKIINSTTNSEANQQQNPFGIDLPIKSYRRMLHSASSIASTLEYMQQSNSSDNGTMIANDEPFPTIVKTKRYRVRHRKRKHTPGVVDIKQVIDFKPPNTVASPKLHIRFNNVEENSLNNENGVETNDVPSFEFNGNDKGEELNFCTTTITDIIKNSSQENREYSFNDDELNFKLTNDEIVEQFPKLENTLPKTKDIICFKILRMNNSFCPVVSSIITAKVQDVSVASNTVNVEILAGLDQCEPPVGKFSFPVCENEADDANRNVHLESLKYQEYTWNNLIEPRLIFP